MSVIEFDKTESYAEEAKGRWGGTDAWAQYEKNDSMRTQEQRKTAAEGMMRIFAQLGGMKDLPPESNEAQSAIARLQSFISDNYYDCTDQILSGLGEMYLSDRRFTKNIDSAGGEGTARFVSEAIKIYCAKAAGGSHAQ